MAEALVRSLRQAGFSVAVNRPFAGTIVPLRYYGKEPRVRSVMIEVNRGLYLRGEEKGAGFDQVRRVIRGAVKMSIYDERQYY